MSSTVMPEEASKVRFDTTMPSGCTVTTWPELPIIREGTAASWQVGAEDYPGFIAEILRPDGTSVYLEIREKSATASGLVPPPSARWLTLRDRLHMAGLIRRVRTPAPNRQETDGEFARWSKLLSGGRSLTDLIREDRDA